MNLAMDESAVLQEATETSHSNGRGKDLKLAILLWSGQYGGAETWSVALARALRNQGVSVGLVIVGQPGPIAYLATRYGIRVESIGLSRGAEVLLRPRSLAGAVNRVGSHAVISPSAGYLAAALRLGGYAGKTVAVEHGALLQLENLPWHVRWLRLADLVTGLWAVDAQVAPSDYMQRALSAYPHKNPVVRIYHGLYFDGANAPGVSNDALERKNVVVGFAGRLIRGKGVETLLRAVSNIPDARIRVEIAGDGLYRPALEAMTIDLGIADRVRFHGWVHDTQRFWKSCDVAVVPSEQWVESFGMVVIEAMAAGLPTLATRRGALPELVCEGKTGALFEAGHWEELASLLATYARDKELRREQGAAARDRCQTMFSISNCATRYVQLIHSLIADGSVTAQPGLRS